MLGINWLFANTELPEKSLMEELSSIAKSIVPPSIVCWSGSTKLEKGANNKMTGKQRH